VVLMNSCLALWLDHTRRRAKRALTNLDRFYPHSILTFYLQLSVAYKYEIDKFARMWCDSGSNLANDLVNEIVAVKEIFEVENKDDIVWFVELLSNGYTNENIDRLIYLASTMKR
jgi:hypothetical protein